MCLIGTWAFYMNNILVMWYNNLKKEMNMNNREKATEIVEELRKHFNEFDSGVRYAFFGIEKDDNLISDYKQSDIIHQVVTIEILLDRGIEVDVINGPIGLIENDNGDTKPLTIRSWKVEEGEMLDIEDDVKLIVFYMWYRLPEFKIQ